MPISLIISALSILIAVLAGICFWLYRRTRRLEDLLSTRHALEEMLAQPGAATLPAGIAADDFSLTPGAPVFERPAPAPVPLVDELGDDDDQAGGGIDGLALDGDAPKSPDLSESGMPHLLLELEPEAGDEPLDSISPGEPLEPAPAALKASRPAVRPLVLGVISHKGGTAKTTTALELARCWAGEQRRILLVDTDPVRAAGHLLGIEAPAEGEIHGSANGLYYVHWQPPRWPQPARWPEHFLTGWDLVVVDTPSLQNPIAIQQLPLFDALLLTLTLEPASMRVLEQGAILLERRLDPRRQRLLGVLVARYQPDQALQTSLFASLQREYVGILLPEVIPEDPGAWQEMLEPGSSPIPTPFQLAYENLANRLYAQLQPLKERAGGQT